MKAFDYTVREQSGIHARPAVKLAMESQKYNSRIILFLDEKTADASDVMAIMGLNIKFDDIIRVEITGTDEDTAYEGLRDFLFNRLPY
ncbi:Phosphotransferase system, phosphocarrier protein HPr [[Clostridium] saccharolyticum WM1]|uniref:Phosphocarrier protein HPr n=2 Tax=Lacrimispora TaxID=2719231 RepID=D9R891_LACSW|nr:Phosphotransferase system, phosphocarrier protein HPr [[Clostridium] saccharolyticum WM1]